MTHSYIKKYSGLSTYVLDALVASQRSKVTKKRMGSVLIGRITNNVWHLISDGCNGVKSGDEHVFEEKGVTLQHVLHAEHNCLSKLDLISEKLSEYQDVVLIVNSSPCPKCAELIASKKEVDHVIYIEEYRDDSGLDTLSSSGVTHEQVDPEYMEALQEMSERVSFEILSARLSAMISKNGKNNESVDSYQATKSFIEDKINPVLRSKSNTDHLIHYLRTLRYSITSALSIIQSKNKVAFTDFTLVSLDKLTDLEFLESTNSLMVPMHEIGTTFNNTGHGSETIMANFSFVNNDNTITLSMLVTKG